MPKVDIIIKPSEQLPKELATFLTGKFSAKDLEKLEKFGGRIQVSVTAPFSDRKHQDKNVFINDYFIKNLITDLSNAEKNLKPLTKKQLFEIAGRLNFPVTSKSTTQEVRDSLIKFLNSENTWLSISGSTKNVK